VNTAVVPAAFKVTAPATGAAPVTVNVEVVTVVGSRRSENVALTVVEMATPVAPAAGVVLATVGGVVSLGGAVGFEFFLQDKGSQSTASSSVGTTMLRNLMTMTPRMGLAVSACGESQGRNSRIRRRSDEN
jgi:hypothetical protein